MCIGRIDNKVSARSNLIYQSLNTDGGLLFLGIKLISTLEVFD
jgi:hypothetical protein